MANVDLIVVLGLLCSTSEPNTKAIIQAAITELERLRQIEEGAVEMARMILNQPPIWDLTLAEQVLKLAEAEAYYLDTKQDVRNMRPTGPSPVGQGLKLPPAREGSRI